MSWYTYILACHIADHTEVKNIGEAIKVLSLFIWLAALLLFVKTSRVTVHDTVLTYNVTAGIGPFNASYIDPFFEMLKSISPGHPYQVLPDSASALAYSLVVSPTKASASSPVWCSLDHICDSYFLSGGLVMTTPWLPGSVSKPTHRPPDLHPGPQTSPPHFPCTPSAQPSSPQPPTRLSYPQLR
ncbi:hypothetical protein B0T25DRAFT_361876 [Lasiosphaeria hispida]|uniref:Uncharacterized protein n=1 Tax=Lasiosphaeria hispida TaxID=260671 RepID=A0AAJ0M7N3_9PEZI|nr:hypothetical protein B0T25DRAFT_361876 [Lasiosphaeria hispida]